MSKRVISSPKQIGHSWGWPSSSADSIHNRRGWIKQVDTGLVSLKGIKSSSSSSSSPKSSEIIVPSGR